MPEVLFHDVDAHGQSRVTALHVLDRHGDYQRLSVQRDTSRVWAVTELVVFGHGSLTCTREHWQSLWAVVQLDYGPDASVGVLLREGRLTLQQLHDTAVSRGIPLIRCHISQPN